MTDLKSAKESRICDTLARLKQEHLLRQEICLESPADSHVILEGKEYLQFASNNYLGLAGNPRLVEAAGKALARYGVGSCGSRLTTGTQTPHRELERALANFKGTEAAVLFNTGYAANSGIIPALCGKGDVIFSDELNHASIIDGCRLSGAITVVYRHNDMKDLEAKVREFHGGNRMVVSDAVFSMDGDVLRLPEMLDIAEKYGLFSMIDEAHSTGVLGKTGHGILEHFGISKFPDLLMGTLSKALGAEGGYVCCSNIMSDFLRNKCRSYIFSTALPAATAAAAREALAIIESEPKRIEKLQDNIAFFLQELGRHGIRTSTASAIFPIIIGDSQKAVDIGKKLKHEGFLISAIRHPSVPQNAARLRITLMATHARPEISQLANALAKNVRK